MTILVTGGAGFIGSNFVRAKCAASKEQVINLDALTYAGNPQNLNGLPIAHHIFHKGDIGNIELVTDLLSKYQPRVIINFAAESHVDRSILGAEAFVQTNVLGTLRLLEASRNYWEALPASRQVEFRFLHVSTDEVYGSLLPDESPFQETTAYQPNSPYAASKASSDHLVRAFHETYELPTLVTNCSNNYGPYQFPEKLIPLMILNAVNMRELPVYGDGQNVRDWLYVEDHCTALDKVLTEGKVGETYNIGGRCELSNNEVVEQICEIIDGEVPAPTPRKTLIKYVEDRKGHDRRYAVDCSKIERELGWFPRESFSSGLMKTVRWYLTNPEWSRNVTSGKYREWLDLNYRNRA